MAALDNAEAMRVRAHEIWEREGRPHGREHQHWAEAARQLAAKAEAVEVADGGPATEADEPEAERPRKTCRKADKAPGNSSEGKILVAAANVSAEGSSSQAVTGAEAGKKLKRKA